jgi:trehalose synthase
LEEEYDLIVAHDPQPLACPYFHGRGGTRWIWRSHIDTSEPNPELWAFLRPYLEDYDAAVFTLGKFVPPEFPVPQVEVIPPAIDPESPKNIELSSKIADRILGWLGVELDKPLVTQVSRFDPWKDQPGIIEASDQGRCPTSSSRSSDPWLSTIPKAGRCIVRSKKRPVKILT